MPYYKRRKAAYYFHGSKSNPFARRVQTGKVEDVWFIGIDLKPLPRVQMPLAFQAVPYQVQLTRAMGTAKSGPERAIIKNAEKESLRDTKSAVGNVG